jgi:replicative DNA helicase
VLVDILAKHRRRRELIRLGGQIQTAAQEGEEAPEVIADRAARELADLTASRRRGGLVAVKDGAARVIEMLHGSVKPGTFTGFNRLDGMTQGFQPGQFIILSARPGIGKTTLAMNWALHAVSAHGWVPVFSLEMLIHELIRRMACDLGNVPAKAVKDRSLTQGQLEGFLRAVATLEAMPLVINDAAAQTVQQIRAQVIREATRRGCPPALIVVDHVGLVASPDAKGKTEAQRIGEISGALKVLAKDAQAPVVALSQMNREVEKERRKPRLSDLRDSGSLEQDADIVCFLHRDAKPQMGQDQLDKSATLIIAKHRDGELGEIPMQFEGGFCRYEEAPERHTGTDDGRGWA